MWNLGYRATPGGVRGVTWRNEGMPRRVDLGCHPKTTGSKEIDLPTCYVFFWLRMHLYLYWCRTGVGCSFEASFCEKHREAVWKQTMWRVSPPFAFGWDYRQSGRPFGVRFIPIPTLWFMSITGKMCFKRINSPTVRLWVPRLIISSTNRRFVYIYLVEQ